MASLLRQIVAGPRTRHPEAGLDLCYVTDYIVATSGPSQTYPQLAYRNPLDQLVAFLDSKHGEDWAIWEFRAEGTGYPDDAVYNRIRHYPWPDHHPPPFRLVPMIMASMRNWLHGGDLGGGAVPGDGAPTQDPSNAKARDKKRVVVVHCKAGKGRSGTASCSYLISEEGWKAEDALARFTERRMRPKFGNGVSIPSQLRWVSYVDRWTKNGKKYRDRPIEILEIHVWGLRNGVKVDVEGFVDEGKKIETFHTFKKEERIVVQGDAPEGGGFGDMVWELAGYAASPKHKAAEETELADDANAEKKSPSRSSTAPADESASHKLKRKGTNLISKVSAPGSHHTIEKLKVMTGIDSGSSSSKSAANTPTEPPMDPEPGGMAVILRPSQPIRIPGSDINIAVERRNKTHKSLGLTMVSAVAHVWFNAYFDGQGPEQDGKPSDSGVFSLEWEGMDGIKGSSRKGARALDRIAVVWRAAEGTEPRIDEELDEPKEGQSVPQLRPADWKGANKEDPHVKDLGLRVQSPMSADVSRASSVRSSELATDKKESGHDATPLEGLKCSGPAGDDLLEVLGQRDGSADETKASEEVKAEVHNTV